MNFLRLLDLQLKDERRELSAAETKELEAMELEWHNDAIDPTECPSRAI